MLVIDTSGSMLATDVQPERLDRAPGRARRSSSRCRTSSAIGVIAFGSTAQQLAEPTTDRAQAEARDRLAAGAGATAMGDALKLGDRLAPRADARTASAAARAAAGRDRAARRRREHARRSDPIDVAQETKKYKIPVYTVALGTQSGTLDDHAADGATPSACRRTC